MELYDFPKYKFKADGNPPARTNLLLVLIIRFLYLFMASSRTSPGSISSPRVIFFYDAATPSPPLFIPPRICLNLHLYSWLALSFIYLFSSCRRILNYCHFKVFAPNVVDETERNLDFYCCLLVDLVFLLDHLTFK